MPIPDSLSSDPYAILDPDNRWQPGSDAELPIGGLMPPLVERVRQEVKEWRDSGYPNISDTTRALLSWWFDRAEDTPEIRYYFSQREAVESVLYLYEAAKVEDKYNLLRYSAGGVAPEMMPENWRRYVIKMATGSGKTKVISLLIAWSYFHKHYETDSPLSRNILLIAPNIIVLDRLYRDFESLRIFHEDHVIPHNGYEGRDWESSFTMQLHKQDEVRSHVETGNLFLTNIHRVYVRDITPPSAADEDTRDYFLGPKPKDPTDNKVDLGDLVRDLDELLIINDEAHHIHDGRLAWFKTIEDLHNTLVQKDLALSLQVDMTATPKHNNGVIFAQTIADYPLVEAIHQNVVKRPVVPDDESAERLEEQPSANYAERYADYIDLGVKEWRKAYEVHKQADRKAILFLMTDDTKNCDELGRYLEARYHDLKGKTLVIHTKKNGELTESAASGKKDKELTELRKQAATIDNWDNPYRAIVSVLVLREGWDVRNVTTIVGLRAYSAKSKILPEQTLGRGLRLMYPDANDSGEKVSIIGTPVFAEFVKEIEKEGVKLERVEMGTQSRPQTPIVIAIDRDNSEKNTDELDIHIPIISRRFFMDFSKLNELNAASIQCKPVQYKTYPANGPREIVFRDVLTGEVSHKTKLSDNTIDDCSRVIGYFTSRVMVAHQLFSQYDFLYEVMRDFIRDQLFDASVDMESDDTIRNLAEPAAGQAIMAGFDTAIKSLLTQKRPETETGDELKVSVMRPFPMKPPKYQYKPNKSPQNLIAENFLLEYEFARFLDRCPDVAAFAKNYFAVNFRLDYVKTDGAIANYFPDFLIRDAGGKIWIAETKGRIGEDDLRKRHRLRQWCSEVRNLMPDTFVGALFVEENMFTSNRPNNLADLIQMFEDK